MPSYKQFNHITGRLQNSAHIQPLYPITPAPLQRANPSEMIWDTIKTKPVQTDIVKSAKMSTLPPRIAEQMKLFQTNIEIPVYIKAGARDKALYGLTIVLAGALTVWSATFISRYINKK